VRSVSHINHDVAVSRALACKGDGLIELIEFYGNNSGVRKNELYVQTFDLLCKSVTVLILEVDWEAKRRAQRQIKCVVGLHRGNCIYILN